MQQDNVDDVFSLTPMQRLMLIHAESAPVPFGLSHQFRYRISGDLEVDRFRRSWTNLVDRHPALRMAFFWDGLKRPVQVVRAKVNLPFHYKDLSSLPRAQCDQRLAEIQDADRRGGFDLRKAPLIRLTLVRIVEDEFRLIWSRYHLILDRWCVDLLFDELFAHYAANDSSAQPSLSPVRSFQSYVEWIDGQDKNDAEIYWRGALRDFARPTLLFSSKARRTQLSMKGLPSVDQSLNDNVFCSLKRLAIRNRLTLASLVQASVAILVAGRTGADDVAFGLTVSGRPPSLSGVEWIMGSFINNVPLRVRIDSYAGIIDWVRSIQTSQNGRYAFEHISPVEIHGWTVLPAAAPLFDLLLLLHSPSAEVRKGPGFDIEQISSPLESAYPFTLAAAETMGRFRLSGVYDPLCVSHESALRLLDRLTAILEQIAVAPGSRVGMILRTVQADSSLQPSASLAEQRTERRSRKPDKTMVEANSDGAVCVLTDIWQDTLGVECVGLDDDFFALGGTSIQAARAFAQMLPLSTLFRAGNIRQILEVLRQPQARTSSLVEIQPHGPSPQLFVVPGIGGNVVILDPLARSLGTEQPFYGLQSKGLDGQEPPSTRIEDIASDYIAEMSPMLKEPYVVFGICWGALVAFEMAQQLSERGRPPAGLIVMDPVFVDTSKKRFKFESRFNVMLKLVVGRLKLYWLELRTLDNRQRWKLLRDKLTLVASAIRKRDLFQGNRMEINQMLVSEANLEARLRYSPKPYRGAASVILTSDRGLDLANDPRLRWMKFFPESSPVRYVPGRTTGESLSREYVDALAIEVKDCLARVQGAYASCRTENQSRFHEISEAT